jgi:hypothetical protein
MQDQDRRYEACAPHRQADVSRNYNTLQSGSGYGTNGGYNHQGYSGNWYHDKRQKQWSNSQPQGHIIDVYTGASPSSYMPAVSSSLPHGGWPELHHAVHPPLPASHAGYGQHPLPNHARHVAPEINASYGSDASAISRSTRYAHSKSSHAFRSTCPRV